MSEETKNFDLKKIILDILKGINWKSILWKIYSENVRPELLKFDPLPNVNWDNELTKALDIILEALLKPKKP
jgi:hypothetical protein